MLKLQYLLTRIIIIITLMKLIRIKLRVNKLLLERFFQWLSICLAILFVLKGMVLHL